MKISKRRKITAWITLSVMLVAVVAVTTGVLATTPSAYHGEDVEPANTASDYTIDQVSYNKTNTVIGYAATNEGNMRVLYPTKIFIDKNENLNQTGYYTAYDVWAHCTYWSFGTKTYKTRILVYDNVSGFYSTQDTSCYKPDTTSNCYTMHNTFDNYGFKERKNLGASDGSTPTVQADIATKDIRNTLLIMECTNVCTVAQNFLQGSVKDTYKNQDIIGKGGINLKFVPQTETTLGCLQYDSSWKDANPWKISTFSDGDGKDFNKISEVAGAPYSTNIEVAIHIYDKSALNTAINNFKTKFGINDSNYNNIPQGRFIKGIIDKYLKKREVSQGDINDATTYVNNYSAILDKVNAFDTLVNTTYKSALDTIGGTDCVSNANTFKTKIVTDYLTRDTSTTNWEVVTDAQKNEAIGKIDNYKFKLTTPIDTEQSADRGSGSYNGQNHTLNSANMGRFGTSNNTYFNFKFQQSGVDKDAKNAGIYDVFAQPKATANGMNFCWATDNTDYKKIGTYTINKATLSFKAGALLETKEYDYKNQDYEVTVTSALSSGNTLSNANLNNYYGDDLNVYVAQSDDFTGVVAGNKISLKDAGSYTIYYRISGDNYKNTSGGDYVTGNFAVEIKAAEMSIKENIIEDKTGDSALEFKNSAYTITLESALKQDCTLEFDNYYPAGNPMTIVYVIDAAGKNANAIDWTGATSSVSLTNVGEYTVYYKASANNHKDFASSFAIEIEKANIQLTVDKYTQTYGDTLLTSEGIIDNMLKNATAKVLDAETPAAIKTYLTAIFTSFRVSGTVLEDGFVKVGEYAIAYTRNAEWNDRIASVTFTNDASKAYAVTPKEIKVGWTQQSNLYYNGEGDKRPEAAVVSGAINGIAAPLSAVKLSGPGKDADGNEVALVNGEAINAGTYEAYVTCENTNYVVDEDTTKCEFVISPRPITVKLTKRERAYGSKSTATATWNNYINVLFPDNSDNEVYTATVDTAVVKDGKDAIVDPVKSVFSISNDATEADYTSSVEAERYFKVKTYHLSMTLISKNYVFNSDSVGADFVIKPADIKCNVQSIASKVYNGGNQNLVLPNNNTDVKLQGFEATHRDDVTIYYSATGADNTWSTTPLSKKDAGTYTVYYKIEAPNHNTLAGENCKFTATISGAAITVNVAKTASSTYGDDLPTSEQLVDKLGITLTWTNTSAMADIYDRLIFELADATDNRTNAGKYSLTHSLADGELDDNFDITYAKDANGKEVGTDVYTINKKKLYVEWKQEGDNWDESGMKYTYDGKVPQIKPVAPATYKDDDGNDVINIVSGDSISLATKSLGDDIVGTYTVNTALSTDHNLNNYYIGNSSAQFNIVKRVVEINVKNQSATFGNAKKVQFYTELQPDDNKNAMWAYPSGTAESNKFVGEDYTAFHLTSIAHSAPDGQFMDEGQYPINLEVRSGEANAAIAANYDYSIVKEGAPDDMQATFYITKAQIGFGAKAFNIDYDKIDEKNYVTKAQMKETISTAVNTPLDEFTVAMSDLFQEGDSEFSSIDNVAEGKWVDTQTREISDIGEIGVYYVWVRITHICTKHNHSNYEKFETKVQVNILSGWVSIKIKKGIDDAQYGNDVHTSLQIFNGLKDNIDIYGGIKDGENSYVPFTVNDLKDYVEDQSVKFYVLNSDTTPMKKNASFGNYTIEIEVDESKVTSKVYKYFRFLDAEGTANAGKPTTNIGAYKVGQRIIGINFGTMNEIYGEHTSTSASHTYTLENVLEREDGTMDVVFVDISYERKENGVWVSVGHSSTLPVGRYRATMTAVHNTDYKLNDDVTTRQIEYDITKRIITIEIADREGMTADGKNKIGLVYGASENATRGGVENFLNTIVDGFTRYTVAEGSLGFVGGDSIDNVFRFVLGEYTLDSKYTYLFAGDYDILVETTNANYDVRLKDDQPGVLTIANSDGMKYDRNFITGKVYSGKEMKVVDPLNNVLQYIKPTGDAGTLLDELDAIDHVQYKLAADDDSKYDAQYTIKNAGNYTINIKVCDIPNHNDKVFTVSLKVEQAYVLINMTATAEKEYGDTEDDLIAKDNDPKVTDLSKWLIKHCNITVTAFDKKGGSEIDVEGIEDDFIFKVVASGNGPSDALEIGTHDVGTYRVYHRTDSVPNIANYEVDYVAVAGADNGYCNSDSYQVNPKKVSASDVTWITTGHIDGVDNKFEFSNARPDVKASYTLLGESAPSNLHLTFSWLGEEGKQDTAVTYGVGTYGAKIDIDTEATGYEKFANYDFSGVATYEFQVAPKNVTVIIKNQEKEYGEDDSKVGVWDWSNQFTRVTAGTFAGNPVKLSIDFKTDKKYYDVNEEGYHIVGECTSKHYSLTFKGEDSDNDYATFKVTPTEMNVNYPRHTVSYNGKAFNVDVKSILAANKAYSLKGEGDVLWDSAIVTYKQEDGSYTSDIAVIDGITSGNGLDVEYKVTIANHVEFIGDMTIEINPAELVINIAKGAGNVYGEDVLSSDELFESAALDTERSSMTVSVDVLKTILTLRVNNLTYSTANKANKGTYNIGFAMNGEYGTLYDVELVGEEGAYSVTAKTLTVTWNYTSAFEYDGDVKTIGYALNGIVTGDTVTITDLRDYSFTNAGDYVAKASRLSNSNYALAQETTLNWTISPKAIEIEWVAGDFTYNGAGHTLDTPTIKDNQLVGNDTCDITVEIDDNVNAGTHTATAKTTNGNYVVDNNTFEIVIKQALVSINWKETVLTYNGKEQAPKAELVGDIYGDDKCNVIVSGVQKNAGENYSAVAALDNSNYAINDNASTTFKINAKAITFTWENTDTLKYTGEAQAPNAVTDGVVDGDEIEFIVTGAQINAGSGYVATVTGINNSNYVIDAAQQTSMTTNYSIGKGTNTFIDFVIPDKAVGSLPWIGDDKPQSKWGEVIVKYYSDAECTQEVADINNAGEGKYWVKLTVEGNDNYDTIEEVVEIVLEGGLDLTIVIAGAIISLVLLISAIAVVKTTNKKKQKGGAK